MLKEPTVFIEEEPTTSRQIYRRSFEFCFNDVFENRGYYQNWVLDSFENRGSESSGVALITIRGLFPFLITAQHWSEH
jgi:hypothetical protein